MGFNSTKLASEFLSKTVKIVFAFSITFLSPSYRIRSSFHSPASAFNSPWQIAICHGELNADAGEWNDDLIRYDGDKKVIEKAKTIFTVLDKNSEASLVELKPITGRKHQLRKQLYALGQPIFGDIKYKLSNSSRGLNKNLMLHSYQIKFIIDDIKHTYTALLPDYFRKLLKTKRLRFSGLK